MNKRPLDDLLKDWAARRQPAASELDRLADRVARAVADAPAAAAAAEQPVRAPVSWWPRLALLAAGAAAGFAVALLVRAPAPETPDGVLSLVRIAPAQVETRRALFGEMEQLFAGHLRWCSVSGHDVQMGMAETPARGTVSPNTWVRLVVTRRASGATEWQRVWEADILARNQEFVELNPNPGQGNRVAMWVYANEDGTLVVESTVDLQAPVTFVSSTASVSRPGVPVEIATLTTADAEYRVFQTASQLPAREG